MTTRWVSLALGVACATAEAGAPRIDRVSALPDAIHVRLAGDGRSARLVSLPCYADRGSARDAPTLWEGALTDSPAQLPRVVAGRDLLYGQFILLDSATGLPLAPPHWVDDLDALPAWPQAGPRPPGIKGVTCPGDVDDLIALGVQHIDTNVMLSQVLDLGAADPPLSWEVDGERIGINAGYIESLDRQLLELARAGISVTIILLNGVPSAPDAANPLIHPRTDLANAPNHLGAFNLTDERGFRCYRAAIEFLAHRYSDPAGERGFVSGWIIGNEMQSHWAWSNYGEMSDVDVVADYARALRMAWLAVSRYTAAARVYVSLDHCWTIPSEPNPLRATTGARFLELLNGRVRAGGDFPWQVAFHPYPENLFDPRFWNDRLAWLSFDTPKITFRNLEVLPAYLGQERFLYRGEPRRIILSEQGFHCPDTPEGEDLQAAAYALAYYRTSRIPGIDAFILHRHIDHRGEFGLHLGLWSADPDGPDPSRPLHKRRIWDVFRAADAPEWEQAFEFALPVVGIDNWGEASPAAGPFPRSTGRRGSVPGPAPGLYDLRAIADRADHATCGDWRASWETFPDGKLYPTLFQHSPLAGPGVAEAHYNLDLPEPSPGYGFAFVSRAAVLGPGTDGVRMSVLADGREVWSATVLPGDQHDVRADLPPFRGGPVRLSLCVDSLATNAGDWANWAHPAVVRVVEPLPIPERPFESDAITLGPRETYTRETLSEYMNGGAAFYLGYSLEWLAVWRARVAEIDDDVVLELYAFSDPADALGVFIDRAPADSPFDGFERGREAKGLFRGHKGRYFVRVLAPRRDAIASDVATRLGRSMGEALPAAETTLPAVLRALPPESQRPGALRYFHTKESLDSYLYLADANLMGLSDATQCGLASYEAERGKPPAKVLMIRYPDPAACRQAFRDFREGYLEHPVTDDGADSDRERIEDGTWVVVNGCDSPPALTVVTDASDAEWAADAAARALLGLKEAETQ